MSDWVRNAIIDRLHGVHIHIDPLSALDYVNEADMNRKPFGGRSLRELLFHMIFWQDYSLKLMMGEVGGFEKGMDWDVDDISWEELVERFSKGLSRLEFIAENYELDDEISINEDVKTCAGAEILGTVQHTSYHLGQIVTTRRALGLWNRE